MIQTLGDVFLLIAILSVGLVSFLLAVLLYHLIFVVMDLRQVMRRLNDLTAEIEEMLVKPVELAGKIADWLQRYVWDEYFADSTPHKASRGRRRRKSGKNREA